MKMTERENERERVCGRLVFLRKSGDHMHD